MLRRGTSSSSLVVLRSYSGGQSRGFGGSIWAAITGAGDGGRNGDGAPTTEVSAAAATSVPTPSSSSTPSSQPTTPPTAATSSATGGSALKKAMLSGRRAARSSLFETAQNNSVVAVERPSGSCGGGANPSSSAPSSVSGGGGTSSVDRKLAVPSLKPHGGGGARGDVTFSFPQRASSSGGLSPPSLRKPLPPTIVVGIDPVSNSLTPLGGSSNANSTPSIYREGVFDGNGQPVLTREALLDQRGSASTRELKDAIAQIVPPTARRTARSSSVRYKADVRQGQHVYTVELLKVIKAKKDPRLSVEEAIHTQCDFLNARERLDLLRMTSRLNGHARRHKRINKRSSTPTKRLPTYYSPEFKKNFYFREEDLLEKSALGHGPGGQAANRRMQTIHVLHVPTQITVRFSHFPSLYANRKAARTILSLRVEQRELGEASHLSRMAAAKSAKRQQRFKRRVRLERHSVSMAKKAKHRHPFVGFLNGLFALGEAFVPKCALLGTLAPKKSSASTATSGSAAKGTPQWRGSPSAALAAVRPRQPVMVSTLLDTHANRWWNILSESFYNHWCRPLTVKTFVRTADNTMVGKRRICGWAIGASRNVPSWFCYFFPIVCSKPPPIEKPSREVMLLAHATTAVGVRGEGGGGQGRGRRKGPRQPLLAPPPPSITEGGPSVPFGSSMVQKDLPCANAAAFDAVAAAAAAKDSEEVKADVKSAAVVGTVPAATEGGEVGPSANEQSVAPSSSDAAAADFSSSASDSSDAEQFVSALMTEEARQEALLKAQQEEARSIFFEYLKHKKRHDIVARTIQYHEDQLAQFRAMPEGKKAVLSAVNAVVEVFGLYVETGDSNVTAMSIGGGGSGSKKKKDSSSSSSSSPLRYCVRKDGPNWAAHRDKLCTADGQHVTPLAAAVFPHMIVSLQRLGMAEEAEGLRGFFKALAESTSAAGRKKNGGDGSSVNAKTTSSTDSNLWAVEMMELIEDLEREKGGAEGGLSPLASSAQAV